MAVAPEDRPAHGRLLADAVVGPENRAIQVRVLLDVALAADDAVSLKIDGKAIKNNDELVLAKGDREIQIVFWEGTGNASVSVKWKPEGGADQDLPPALMFHEPRQIEKYGKK